MPDTPPKKLFRVLQGGDVQTHALFSARRVFADPKLTFTMVTQDMFTALFDDAVQEQRQQEIANTLEFPAFDRDVLDAIGSNVIRQILAKLARSTAWRDEDEDAAHAYLENFLEKYIQDHS